MWEDPIVAEVRAIREALAAKHNYDIHAIFEDMRNRQTIHVVDGRADSEINSESKCDKEDLEHLERIR